MSASLRVLTLAGGLIGGCSGVPWLIGQWQQKENSTTTNSSKVDFDSRPAPSHRTFELVRSSPPPKPKIPEPVTKIGNCIPIKSSETLESMLWYLGIGKDSYTTVSCEKANENEDSKLPNDWTGLFPETLFKRGTSTEKEKFEIKVKTEPATSETDKYNICFSGDGFNGPVTGEWDGNIQDTGEGNLVSITVTGPTLPEDKKIIYLATNK